MDSRPDMTDAAQSVEPGVTDSDLDPGLVTLARGSGPVLSAVLDTETGVEQAGPRLRQRWDALRRRLVADGAPDEVLDRAGSALDEARLDGPVVAVYCAAGGGEPVVIAGPEEEGGDWAVWDRLPRLAPVVRWHQATPPALLVAIDRTGAELISGGRAVEPVLESVTDDEHPYIRRIQPGGWSQRRYQQRAENSWRAMAGEVAERVTEHVEANGTRLVVVAGDVRAVQQFRDQLPDRVARLVRLASGHPGAGSEGGMADDARRWYRTAVAEDTVAVVEHWKQELGRNGLAVTGTAPTLAALEQAAVATLLVHDDPADTRRRPLGPASANLSAAGDVPAAGDVNPLVFEGDRAPRLVDDAIVAAWDTGAGVRVVPSVPEMTDGLGALLRFPLAR